MMKKKRGLTIDITATSRAEQVATPCTREEYIKDLKYHYPDLIAQLNRTAYKNNEINILFTDLDGTTTNKAGGECNSAFRLATPAGLFGPEQEVEISPDHPLFGGKFEELQSFFQNLIANNIIVVPVTQNFVGITTKIMQQLTGTASHGYYGSSFPSEFPLERIYTKVNFMTAVLFYIEDILACNPQFLFLDDSKEEIMMAKQDINLAGKLTICRVSPWLGKNRDLQLGVNAYFGLSN